MQLDFGEVAHGLAVRGLLVGRRPDRLVADRQSVDEPTLDGLERTPDLVILELGANDGLRGLPVAEMEKNLDTILSKLKARNIPVLFAGMKGPRNFGARYAQEYDAVFPKLAMKYDAMFYPFFLEGVALDRALVQPDGLHPNPKGVDVIVKGIEPLAERLVQQAKARRTGAPAQKK